LLFPAGVEQNVPPHKHTNQNIVIYVTKGNFLFEYGDKSIKANSGMFLNFKSNIFHSYKKIGLEEGKLIMIISPAGFENYFKEEGIPIRDDHNTLNIKTDFDRITLHIGETKYGLKFVGE
jgi:mannose-6-phosphate isomerase-like protein (cupin superfamily)